MRLSKLTLLLVPIALIAMTVGMFATAAVQRRAAAHADERSAAANSLLTALVDQETGVRGFLLTGREVFLEPFYKGQRDEARAVGELRQTLDHDAAVGRLLQQHQASAQTWRGLAAQQVIDNRRNPADQGTTRAALVRKGLMDRMRAINVRMLRALTLERDRDMQVAGATSTGAILLLTVILGLIAAFVLRVEVTRRRQISDRDADYRSTQAEFTDLIQVVRSEGEAHNLLKRHLELRSPGAVVSVLNRNNSDNRLEASTSLQGSRLVETLDGDEPSACLAVRLGHRHATVAGEQRLLSCKLCGHGPRPATCQPLQVGGHVIGSVLVEHEATLDEQGDRRLSETVAQAAPVLANLRNLAVAERRATTDVLTGLPNRRAAQDTLLRLSAHAVRNRECLAAIAMDLDHFKDINDRFGHDMGDRVLAAVATLLKRSLRGGDFVSRVGGEEFLILAAETGREGAVQLAENLRAAVDRESVPGLDRAITASFGVAVMPDHVTHADGLLRIADRALYSAKSRGRNRVELAPDTADATAGDGLATEVAAAKP